MYNSEILHFTDPDCYKLVTMSKRTEYTTTILPTTTSSNTPTEESFSA